MSGPDPSVPLSRVLAPCPLPPPPSLSCTVFLFLSQGLSSVWLPLAMSLLTGGPWQHLPLGSRDMKPGDAEPLALCSQQAPAKGATLTFHNPIPHVLQGPDWPCPRGADRHHWPVGRVTVHFSLRARKPGRAAPLPSASSLVSLLGTMNAPAFPFFLPPHPPLALAGECATQNRALENPAMSDSCVPGRIQVFLGPRT